MNTIKRSGRRGRPFSSLLRKLKRFFRKAKISVSGFFSKLGAKIKRIDIPAFFRKLSKKTVIIGSCGVTAVAALIIVLCITLGSEPAKADGTAALADDNPIAVATAKPIDNLEELTDEQKDSVVPLVDEERKEDPPQDVYKYGDDHTEVQKIQLRLMELGYMGEDEPTYYYGPTTMQAVTNFQKKCKLDADGVLGKQTYEKLFADDAPYYSITEGAEGTDVMGLQQRLVELGFLEKATGYYGTSTVEAVKQFQTDNGLGIDGCIGKATREKLYSDDVKANVLGAGDEGELVKKYQNKLKNLGYLVTTVDGKYGAGTVEAVKLFQEDNALVVDGYLGMETRELLDSEQVLANVLKVGDKNSMVSRVQKYLKDLGYLSSNPTGYFGEETEKAVKKFQSKNGLTSDGKVGANTLKVLSSSKAINVNGSRGSTSSGVNRFISVAMSKLGSKYVLGAKGPNQFDCSGFVYWCLNQAGVKQSYMTSYYWQRTTRYKRINSMSELRRGDVISYKGHVGICAGNGYMIDASSSNGKVVYRSYQSSYWRRVFVCGYRIF